VNLSFHDNLALVNIVEPIRNTIYLKRFRSLFMCKPRVTKKHEITHVLHRIFDIAMQVCNGI